MKSFTRITAPAGSDISLRTLPEMFCNEIRFLTNNIHKKIRILNGWNGTQSLFLPSALILSPTYKDCINP